MWPLKFKERPAGHLSALGGRSSGMRPLQGHANVLEERGAHTRAASSPDTAADFQLTPICNQRTSHNSKRHVSPLRLIFTLMKNVHRKFKEQ